MLNVSDRYAYVGLVDGAQTVGYGLVHKVSGSIAQVGAAPIHRGQGLEHIILHALATRTASATLVFVNVEQGDAIAGHLLAAGFTRYIGQFEMKYRFTPHP